MVTDVDAPWHPFYRAGLFEPAEVHQAAGMITGQLAVDVEDALARLREHAALVNEPVIDIARAVISRKLCFRSSPAR